MVPSRRVREPRLLSRESLTDLGRPVLKDIVQHQKSFVVRQSIVE